MMTLHRATTVLEDFSHEMRKQIDKWGIQHHPDGTGPDLNALADVDGGALPALWQAEDNADLREIARDRCDYMHKTGRGTWEQILTEEITEAYAESDPVKLRAELVQAGAVIGSWIRDIDSREKAS